MGNDKPLTPTEVIAAETVGRAINGMPETDAVLARAIVDAPDMVTMVARIRAFYHDLDRADRTPRALIYFHFGLLTGIAQRVLPDVLEGAQRDSLNGATHDCGEWAAGLRCMVCGELVDPPEAN